MSTKPSPGRSLSRLIVLFLVLALVAAWWVARNAKRSALPTVANATNALEMLSEIERQTAAQFWKVELEASERGRIVEALWDRINRSTNRLAELAAGFAPAQLTIPVFEEGKAGPHGIHRFNGGKTRSVSGSEWRDLLQKFREEGWDLSACEARFIKILPDTFYVSAHLVNDRTSKRAILEGTVTVEFGEGDAPFRRIDATGVELRVRGGPLAFSEMFYAEVPPPPGSFFIDPLIIWDLDRDGQLEVILAAANVVLRRETGGRWTPDRLIETDLGLIFGGILGDFSGNGTTDFLTFKFEGASLYEGSADGRFSETARPTWTAQPRLKYAQSFSAGDVDADGDLDLFVGQYKLPYAQGQMPFPYFDANDGFPSFLLINDGQGNFTDQTQSSGLAAKRGRRVYSSSLVDLDSDNDPDLVTVSDFAGLDAYENDGTGKFSDATKKWFDDTHGFGMAHSFADFNADGRLDILMIGMNSPTADRLRSANLNRPYDVPDNGMRAAVTFGNRLFLGTAGGRFEQSALGTQIARTGWSWGSAAGDFDNDGFIDLYIANGHATGASVHDYEPQFWLHDIYLGKSQENSLADAYFRQKFARRGSSGHSYGGHERNRFFLNDGGTNFIEAAHLLDVAMPQDSRNVALQDLDRDGKLDLVVTTFEAYPRIRQTIRFFRNNLDPAGGVVTTRLLEPKRTGASGKLVTTRTNAFAVVSGESYRTQVPPEFRIGATAGIEPRLILTSTNTFQVVPVQN